MPARIAEKKKTDKGAPSSGTPRVVKSMHLKTPSAPSTSPHQAVTHSASVGAPRPRFGLKTPGAKKVRVMAPGEGSTQHLSQLRAAMQQSPRAECLLWGKRLRLFFNAHLESLVHAAHLVSEGRPLRGSRNALWLAVGPCVLACLAHMRPIKRLVPWRLWATTSEHRGAVMIYCRPITSRTGQCVGVLLRLEKTGGTRLVEPTSNRTEAEGADPSALACLPGASALSVQHQTKALAPLCEGSPYPSWLLAADGQPTYGNCVLSDMAHAPRPSNGLKARHFIHPDDLSRLDEAWHGIQDAQEDGFSIEMRLGNGHTPWRWHVVHIRSLKQSEKTPLGEKKTHNDAMWLATAYDVQSVKEREQRVDANCCVRKNFLTVASHELHTPLTSLHLNLRLASQKLEKCTSEPRKTRSLQLALERSLRETERLEQVVGDILDAARVKTGRLALNRQHTRLKDVVNEAVTLFARPFTDTATQVVCDVDETLEGDWDSARLGQVFFNLCANVVKHASGSIMTISAKKRHGLVRIAVTDNGPGIKQQFHKSVFRRFERATEVRGVSGLGLGLYLSRRIIKEHGGVMRICRDHGLGTRFIIDLPAFGAKSSSQAIRHAATGAKQSKKPHPCRRSLVQKNLAMEWPVTPLH